MKRRNRLKKFDLLWDGKAQSWPRPHDPGPPGGDLNLWMCAEDLGTEIWGQFRRLEKQDGGEEREPVALTNCSEALAGALIDALPYTHYGTNLSDVVVAFAQVVAQEFVLSGGINFEVRAGWKQGTQEMVEASLVSIPRGSVIGVKPFLFQLIPNDVSDEPSPRMIRLDASRVVAFRPPKRWRRPLSAVRHGFVLLGQSERAWMHEGIEGKGTFSENFKVARREYNAQLARLAAPIGWSFRGRIRDDASDFHLVLRELQWKRVCIEIRDEILTTLRSVFRMIGSFRDEQPDLVWSALPTTDQVDDSLRRLTDGARFDEVLKPFR
jgi:hypothetical protein